MLISPKDWFAPLGRGGRGSIMRLAECDGKALLRRHGLAVPRGVLLRAGEPAPAEAAGWAGHVLKAQVLEGGRGKRGWCSACPRFPRCPRLHQRIADDPAVGDAPILLEEAVAIAQEIYLAVRIDGTRQCLELLVAPEGGEDVERAGSLTRIPIDPLTPTTPGRALSRTAEGVPARPGIPACPLCGAAAGNRTARGSGTAGDQSAGADQGRQVRRLRRQGHPRRQRGRPARPRRSSRSAVRSKGAA